MVNFGVGPAFVLGVFLAVAGAGLYFLRSVRPELSRDHDIFFAAVGLVCGLILMFYGWRLEPALQFGQFLLAGTTIFFAYEAIKLRGIATEQARRTTPIVDEDRPVSRVYQKEAKLDDYDPYEGRRLEGARDRRPDYEAEERRPQRNSRGTRPRTEESQRTRRSRPAPDRRTAPSGPLRDRYEDWNETESYEETDYAASRSRRSRPETVEDEPPGRQKTRRSRPGDTDFDATPVDYQPIESEEEASNGYNSDYDERPRPKRESRYDEPPARSRNDYDPMNYGQPYEDDEEDEGEYDEGDEGVEPRRSSDRFDY
ncbi:Ycf66 family protein [Oscillatoria sp. FACHB-1406]|uniref:Ycf66 family protein n=1 Tax=Oscillatoria sp. FACHB-1406 TaxID=2692846 RepID=UPI00168533FF|nr:Ycf66 family protein [Oscillatoria sp. FACHB-1406]MBD2578860.1 hypothetical protein [Oscillatoria sp. FACHB-1406]